MGILSFRSPRREPRGTAGCHIIGHNLSVSWLSLPWQGSPAHTLPVTLTSLAWEDQIILCQYQIRFVQVSGLHLSAWFGGAHIHESGCAWGLGKEAPGHHHTRASANPPPAPAHRGTAVFRCSPSPWAADGGCGARMGLEIVLWSHRMLLQSAERRKTANRNRGRAAAGLQGCRRRSLCSSSQSGHQLRPTARHQRRLPGTPSRSA